MLDVTEGSRTYKYANKFRKRLRDWESTNKVKLSTQGSRDKIRKAVGSRRVELERIVERKREGYASESQLDIVSAAGPPEQLPPLAVELRDAERELERLGDECKRLRGILLLQKLRVSPAARSQGVLNMLSLKEAPVSRAASTAGTRASPWTIPCRRGSGALTAAC